ncbi:MAG TPA: SagB/ThcOx family dehydrogenase [Desulfatiglandales bacterium]|nr:SagB/ThcOx family dehydrogenase [Desulfatiglandales bacterium]
MQLTRRMFCKLIGMFCLSGSPLAFQDLLPNKERNTLKQKGSGVMRLTEPILDGKVSLERAIHRRRTTRSFSNNIISFEQLSQLLWAAQGITGARGFKRTAPSAGALYPMDIYGAVGEGCIEKLASGVYHYEPAHHSISLVKGGDIRRDIAIASARQMWISDAPLTLIITAEYSRIMVKYGKRGVRYAMIEAGHIGQNIFLQSQAIGLEAGIVGAFEDNKVIQVMGIKKPHEPLLIMPIGHKE